MYIYPMPIHKITTLFPLTLLVILTLSLPAAAQYYIDPPKDQLAFVIDGVQIGKDAPVFDREPAFPGGMFELYRHIEVNVPVSDPQAAEIGNYGEALLVFKLDAAGRVSDPAVLRTNTPSLEPLLLRAVSAMPDWTPAVVDGVETAIVIYLPLAYQYTLGGLLLDQSSNKAIMGREPAKGWIKAVLLVGAIGVLVALYVGLR